MPILYRTVFYCYYYYYYLDKSDLSTVMEPVQLTHTYFILSVLLVWYNYQFHAWGHQEDVALWKSFMTWREMSLCSLSGTIHMNVASFHLPQHLQEVFKMNKYISKCLAHENFQNSSCISNIFCLLL
jgi:hypothetical protein